MAALLRARGLPVIDADAISREVSARPDVLAEIARAIGPQFVRDGRLDRAALAAHVFRDDGARRTLGAIIHPRVRAESARLVSSVVGPWVVHDIPLLFENDLDRTMDATLLVDAPLDVRVERVRQRDGLDETQIRLRDAAQMPAEEKRRRASIVLDNGGDLASLEAQLDAALVTLGVTS